MGRGAQSRAATRRAAARALGWGGHRKFLEREQDLPISEFPLRTKDKAEPAGLWHLRLEETQREGTACLVLRHCGTQGTPKGKSWGLRVRSTSTPPWGLLKDTEQDVGVQWEPQAKARKIQGDPPPSRGLWSSLSLWMPGVDGLAGCPRPSPQWWYQLIMPCTETERGAEVHVPLACGAGSPCPVGRRSRDHSEGISVVRAA